MGKRSLAISIKVHQGWAAQKLIKAISHTTGQEVLPGLTRRWRLPSWSRLGWRWLYRRSHKSRRWLPHTAWTEPASPRSPGGHLQTVASAKFSHNLVFYPLSGWIHFQTLKYNWLSRNIYPNIHWFVKIHNSLVQRYFVWPSSLQRLIGHKVQQNLICILKIIYSTCCQENIKHLPMVP